MDTPSNPKTKFLVVIRGKGTRNEQRIATNVKLYWSETLKQYVSIPEKVSHVS